MKRNSESAPPVQGFMPNCLKGGCYWPGKCSTCGFDRKEAERRKALPLVPDRNGILRKIVKQPESEEK